MTAPRRRQEDRAGMTPRTMLTVALVALVIAVGSLFGTGLVVAGGDDATLERLEDQGEALVEIAEQNRRNGEILVDCTTPGTLVPTREDPRTGHDCYDRGTARSAQAIGQVIDADGDGQVDAIATAEALERIERLLGGR